MEGKVDSRKSVCTDYENEKNLEEKFLDSRIIKNSYKLSLEYIHFVETTEYFLLQHLFFHSFYY